MLRVILSQQRGITNRVESSFPSCFDDANSGGGARFCAKQTGM